VADPVAAAGPRGLVDNLRGRAVVLMHEFGGGPANVEPVAALLREWGALVLTPVLPGHNSRWEDLTDVTWLDWCQAGEAAVDEAIRQTGQPVIVAGVSVGAAIALRMTATLPAQVGAVVAINATLRGNNRLLPIVPILRFVIGSIRTTPDGSLPQTYPRLPTKVLTQLRPLWRDVARRLGSIEQPVMIVRAQSDGQSGTWAAAQIRNAVASRHIADVVLPRAGHVATVGADVPNVARAIADAASLGARHGTEHSGHAHQA
jgi:carboxylesterase